MKTKRVLTLFLALVLLIGCMSGTALAEEGNCVHAYEASENGFKCKNCNHEITVTNKAPEEDIDTNMGYLTFSAACTEAGKTVITVTATPDDGCALKSLNYSNDGGTETAIFGDNFTIPDSVKSVTVNATFISVLGISILDLESGTPSIQESVDFDQYYINTTRTEKVTYNRIKIEWVEPVVKIQTTHTYTWNPNECIWDLSEEECNAIVEDGTNVTKFTLTNYSINAFSCTMGFTPNKDMSGYFESDAATFDGNNGQTLAAVETDLTTGNALTKYYTDESQTTVDKSKLPSLTITGTLNLNMEKFMNAEATTENAEATTEKVACGNYTITCTKIEN